MEMHQIRYFLAVSETLNFTRAAESCHVAQPSLTRAIKKLEDELGGDLFRREGRLTHITDLGRMMLPPLTLCYESAVAAKELADSYRKGDHAPLCLALTHTIDLHLVAERLAQLDAMFPGLELKLFRGTPIEVGEQLKNGNSEVAVAGPMNERWERLTSWPLFDEPFVLVTNSKHELARSNSVAFEHLRNVRILARPYCEQADLIAEILTLNQLFEDKGYHIVSEQDLVVLLEADVGVAIMPASASLPRKLCRISIDEPVLRRTVQLYAVEGRPRSPALNGLIKLLRSADWTSVIH